MGDMPVTLKGTAEGIRLKPVAAAWDDVLRALQVALQEAEAFFRGGRVILEMGERELSKSELVTLRTILDQFDMELWAVLSDNDSTIRTARAYGLRTRLPRSAPQADPEAASAPPGANALLVERTLRSGQSLSFPGHVTLLGDINPGGEVIAGGNVVVWGKVRGVIHAGALGDESACICALELAPSQLRIAGHISRAPDDRRRKARPEIARISDDHIIAEPWT